MLEVKPGILSAVHRFCTDRGGIPVLLIHGSIENARIFYSRKGHGLAPYLATQGFDVFAPDMAGKGSSRPRISRSFQYSQGDTIGHELNAYVAHIRQYHPDVPLRFGAHSWGGVLILAWYALHGHKHLVGPMVFFGSKRRISVLSAKRVFMVDFMWSLVGTLAAFLMGYLPARKLGMGSDNEPRALFLEVNRWVYSRKWKDPKAGFDYSAALRQMNLPPVLFFAGISDQVLGHPADVEKLMREAGGDQHEYVLLARHLGHAKDYGHIDMLTARQCVNDHFPLAARWLQDAILSPQAQVTK